MELEKIRTDFREKVTHAIDGSGLKLEFHSAFNGIPGMQTDSDAEIVRIAEKLTGHSSGTVAFGTEGPYLNSMGMETVILGPGNIEQAHQANEFLAMERISPMMDILTNMIGHFCIEDINGTN